MSESPDPACRSRAYRDGELIARDFPLADLSEWLGDKDVAVWRRRRPRVR